MDEVKLLESMKKLVELGQQKKGVLEITDIDNQFKGFEMTVEQMEAVYQYLEENKIDVLTVMDDNFVADDDILLEPSDEDFERAAVYKIAISDSLKQGRNLLKIDYRGDCARLYSNGKLVADNFYYGRPFMFGLWRLPEGATNLELKVLPMQKDAPIYYPREADRTVGEKVVGMTCEAIR